MLHVLLLAIALLALPLASAAHADTKAAFRQFLETTVRPAAEAAGVSRRTFEAATAGLTPDLSLPDLVAPGTRPSEPSGRWQAEFTNPGRYLDEANLAALTRSARRLADRWQSDLARLERETGVPGTIVLAIWGRESAFGGAKLPHAAVRTLATQAFMGSRRELFLPELIAALRLLEVEGIAAETLRSSWAGAMGQPQFMPSKFLDHARDGDGDGRRDIWASVPDTLASIAHYLADHGWMAGLPWGVEVAVPAAVSCALEGPHQGRRPAEWAAMGIDRVDGKPLSLTQSVAYLLMPAGRFGPAFLVSDNFYVLKRYNESDLYALFIGHLADRIAGPAKIQLPWTPVSGFTRGDVRRLQERLVSAGHDVGGVDGLAGFRTRVAIGIDQQRRGLEPTCFPHPEDFR